MKVREIIPIVPEGASKRGEWELVNASKFALVISNLERTELVAYGIEVPLTKREAYEILRILANTELLAQEIRIKYEENKLLVWRRT